MREFKHYKIEELKQYLYSFHFTRTITAIHIHHTWKPTKNDYAGEKTIFGIWEYHTKERGWSDIGQHFTVAPDGVIWDGRDLNRDPASILNYNKGAISIEIIGNFDVEILKGPQKKAVIELVRILLKVCDLGKEAVIFHREHSSKTCPGKNIKKDEFLFWLDEQPKLEYVHIRPVEVIRKGKTYKGYILPDGKGYVEVRRLLEDLGEQVDWDNERVVVEPGPGSPNGKLERILKIIIGE
ncbi:MAG: hypothetical protein PWQ67_2176 [Clostridia bacterium]|nr:hypothetical protein [Clostridia bacterium]